MRATWVRADSEIITKSMSRVSAKTDSGNHVPKCGSLNSVLRGGVLSFLESSGASAMTLMATTLVVGVRPRVRSQNLVALGLSGSVPQWGTRRAGLHQIGDSCVR